MEERMSHVLMVKERLVGHIELTEVSRHESMDAAIEAAGELHDNGEKREFVIDNGYGIWVEVFHPLLEKQKCAVCGRMVRKMNLVWTKDRDNNLCRMVCADCGREVMDENGYDDGSCKKGGQDDRDG